MSINEREGKKAEVRGAITVIPLLSCRETEQQTMLLKLLCPSPFRREEFMTSWLDLTHSTGHDPNNGKKCRFLTPSVMFRAGKPNVLMRFAPTVHKHDPVAY